MYEEAAVREVSLWHRTGEIITDEAAMMLADMWGSGSGTTDAHKALRELAFEGEAAPGLASLVRGLRGRCLDSDHEYGDHLLRELDALTAWAETKEKTA